jgi:2-polyprenyl-6-methoxyphenol hydroxylase-like FAD-dependent oxidoreductase
MGAKRHILIAGAGIGGLTAALSLLRAGFDVDVFEQAPRLAEVGAGFQISPNGIRVLYHLGLGKAVEACAWQPEGKAVRLWNTGETWKLFDLGAAAVERYGYPYMMFHRADLHGVLIDAVRREKPDAIHLDARCTGFDQKGATVRLHLANGAHAQGDALIGADGVHSSIRAALFGPDDARYTGCMAWRGVIPADRLAHGLIPQIGTNWIGPGGHLIHYFLRRGELLNVVGIVERADWQVESWSAKGTIDEMAADYAGWHDTVQTLIGLMGTPFKWGLFGRTPMARWTDGVVSLLGDACHPMLPFLAQGAVMALEDGCVLARCLAAARDDLAQGLGRYEALRLARTARTVEGSAENGWRFHNPILAEPDQAADFVDREWQSARIAGRYDWLFTYDATSVAV